MTIIFENFTEMQYFNSELIEFKNMLIEYKDNEIAGRRIDIKTLFPEVERFIERVYMSSNHTFQSPNNKIEIVI